MFHPTTSRTRRRPMGRAVLATSALVLVASACAGDDDDTTDTTSITVADVSTDTTAPTVETEPSDTTATGDSTDDMTADDMTADDMTADDMTADDMTGDDMTGDDMTGDEGDALAADVLTDALSGQQADTFLALAEVVGLDQLTDADEVTLFVPTDDAFTSLSADQLSAIVADPSLATDALGAHAVEGAFYSSDLSDGATVTPLVGDDLEVTIDGDTVMIGEATVLQADVEFEGGVIHIIDQVLRLPEG
jgi:uncharacterized surface protein with fasciclin (FAS1) repeats